jgi:hypothetical protein
MPRRSRFNQRGNASCRTGGAPLARSALHGVSSAFAAAVSVSVLTAHAQAQSSEQPPDKMTKARAEYQTMPNGIYSCATCTLFVPPNLCKVVEGRGQPGLLAQGLRVGRLMRSISPCVAWVRSVGQLIGSGSYWLLGPPDRPDRPPPINHRYALNPAACVF